MTAAFVRSHLCCIYRRQQSGIDLKREEDAGERVAREILSLSCSRHLCRALRTYQCKYDTST